MKGASTSRARWQALLGLLVGGAALAASLALRLRASGEGGGSPDVVELPLSWILGGAVLAALTVASSWLSRPKHDTWWVLGLSPLAAILGLVLIGGALAVPSLSITLLRDGLECVAGFALLASLTRWRQNMTLESAARRRWLDPRRKIRLRKDREKSRTAVPAGSLARGDEFELSPGEDLPVDATVLSGRGFVDESMLLGTTLPTPKGPGDSVFAATTSSIPEAVFRVEGAPGESLAAHRDQSSLPLLADSALSSRFARVASVFLTALAGLAALALGMLIRPARVDGWSWLPLLAGVFLACVSTIPTLRRQRFFVDLLALCHRHGLLVTRAKDLAALARVRRWQIDPNLMVAPAAVEAVAVGGTSTNEMLQIAEALLFGEATPEFTSLAAARTSKTLERATGAALRKDQGVYHGTVFGERWLLGPQQALEDTAGLEVPTTLEGPIEFLRDQGLITWLLVRQRSGVVGAIGIGIGASEPARKAAKSLSATLLPGLPDTTRRVLADAAGIACDGPPLEARDGTLLRESSAPPSAGLRIRVVMPKPRLRIEPDQAPRLLEPGLGRFAELVQELRAIRRRSVLESSLLVLAAVTAALALGSLGLLGGATGGAIGVAATWFASRTLAR